MRNILNSRGKHEDGLFTLDVIDINVSGYFKISESVDDFDMPGPSEAKKKEFSVVVLFVYVRPMS